MKEMVNEIKLRELFDAEFEKQKEFVAGLFRMGERERLTIFKWFCLGFQHSYGAPLFAKVRQNMSEERHQQILRLRSSFMLPVLVHTGQLHKSPHYQFSVPGIPCWGLADCWICT